MHRGHVAGAQAARRQAKKGSGGSRLDWIAQHNDTHTAARRPSEHGGAHVNLQAVLPEVQGQIPKRPTSDRLQPDRKAVEAAKTNRVGNQGGGQRQPWANLKVRLKLYDPQMEQNTPPGIIQRWWGRSDLGRQGPVTTPPRATRRQRQHRT